MAKDTFYFSHDFGARNDPKLINLQIKWGMVGIGCYWCIVEMLYENGGMLPLEYDRISFVLRTEENVIRSVINDFKLFLIKDDLFTSQSVIDRIDARKGKSAKARESINKRWNKAIIDTNVPNNETNVPNNDTIKESKVKESKVNKTICDFSETKNILNSENEIAWREQIMLLSPIKSDSRLKSKLNEFLMLKNASEFFPNSITDTKRYFANWLRSQKPEEEKPTYKSLQKIPTI